MSQNKQEIRNRVVTFLTGHIGPVTVSSIDHFSFHRGSATVNVSIDDLEGGYTVVELRSYTNTSLHETPELLSFVAYGPADAEPFASIRLEKADELVSVVVFHRLLGEFLDLDELAWAAESVSALADRLDDELHMKFGGDAPAHHSG